MTRDSLETIRVGLAGCGVVGGALVQLLHDSGPAIAARHGIHFELSRVLVRDVDRYRGVPLASNVFTNDAALFNTGDFDVIVEAIGGEDTASDIARSALSRGKSFVTANKQLVAAAGPELAALAQRKSAALDFGAAVGGSAPVISLLRDLLGTATPASVRGILNGTSNYILTHVENGMSFDDALDAARRAGLAEADCSRDLDGRDAAAKLAIICWLSYGIAPGELNVRRIPLTALTQRLVHRAAELGGKVRVICECQTLSGNGVATTVEPVVVPATSAFARTELEDNRVEVDLGWSAPLAVSGPGAGGAPTATALLSDLLHASLPLARREHSHTRFVAADDPHEHTWLIVPERGDEDTLNELKRAGQVMTYREESGDHFGILFHAPRAAVCETLGSLQLRDVLPAVARIELSEFPRRSL
jgi:homoserine dehydrogenase